MLYEAPVGMYPIHIHYMSVCNSGVLCRIALVDVSGHGHAVSGVADGLLGVMRTHINLICYSDGLSEAADGAGRQIDSDGLMQLARMLPAQSPMAAGATLLGLVDEWRRGGAASDDETRLTYSDFII